MTNEQYHGDTTRVSKSGLDLIEQSPAHYYARYLDPQRVRQTETEALFIGTMIHSAILEPHLFEKNYYTIEDTDKCLEIGGSKPRSTTKYKEWLEAIQMLNKGRIALTQEQFNLAIRMRDAAYSHHAANTVLQQIKAEQTILWEDPETGALCKCRPDGESTRTGYLIDIKSTEDASPYGFGKSVANYRYDVQAAYYTDGYEHAHGIRPEGFVFIAIEKKAPYNVGVYFTTDEIMAVGRRKYQKNLTTYQECKLANKWPGYSSDFQPLILPAWAQNQS